MFIYHPHSDKTRKKNIRSSHTHTQTLIWIAIRDWWLVKSECWDFWRENKSNRMCAYGFSWKMVRTSFSAIGNIPAQKIDCIAFKKIRKVTKQKMFLFIYTLNVVWVGKPFYSWIRIPSAEVAGKQNGKINATPISLQEQFRTNKSKHFSLSIDTTIPFRIVISSESFSVSLFNSFYLFSTQ